MESSGLCGNAKILTESGFKNISECSINDKVSTLSGELINLTDFNKTQYIGQLVSISTTHNIWSISVHPNRPIYTRKYNESPAWIPAEDLTTNHWVASLKRFQTPETVVKAGGKIEGNLVWFPIIHIALPIYHLPISVYSVQKDVYVHNLFL